MPALAAVRTELGAYLRALWNVSPTLLVQGDEASPFLSNLGLHLPADAPREAYRASAAHAAAHLVYSRERFDAASLKPITRALVGLLEDARVEWLACRELPGLRAMWLPFHTAGPYDGEGFEALMQRLARALLDPTYADPHPWVQKGRSLFFADVSGQSLRLRQAAAVRDAASRLGNDIGQMRLPFNPRLYGVRPGYRDDNACLWDEPSRAQPHDAPGEGGAAAAESANPAPDEVPVGTVCHWHREWDRLIGRHRARWCAVHERLAVDSDEAAGQRLVASHGERRPRVWQQPLADRLERTRRLEDGEAFDFDALLQARVAQRTREAPDPRIHERQHRREAAVAELWLLDLSASSTVEQMDGARMAALWAAQGARRSGAACAIDGFRSSGRHAVHYELLKRFDEPMDDAARGRLAAVRGRLSTRLGAAVRHATQRLVQRPEAHRRLFVVTDGDPHDIDIHDPRYLLEDARRAVTDARRQGIEVVGVGLAVADESRLRRVFGSGRRIGVLPLPPTQPQWAEVDGSASSSFGGVAFMR